MNNKKNQGGIGLLLELIKRRFGNISSEVKKRIRRLNFPQRLELVEALSGFAAIDDLEIWLNNYGKKIAIAARLRHLPENSQLVLDLYESLLGADEAPESPARTVDALTILKSNLQQFEIGKIYTLWELGIEPIYIDDLSSVKPTDDISEFHQQLFSFAKIANNDWQSLERIGLNRLTPENRAKLLQAGLKTELIQKLFTQPHPDEAETSTYESSYFINGERFFLSNYQQILTTNYQLPSICKGQMEIQCPFTGEVISSRISIPFGGDEYNHLPIGYVFFSKNISIVLFCTGHTAWISGVFIPELSLIIANTLPAPPDLPPATVNIFSGFVRQKFVKLIRLIEQNYTTKFGQVKNIALLILRSNIGHGIMNDLSGLVKLIAEGNCEQKTEIRAGNWELVICGKTSFGDIEELFGQQNISSLFASVIKFNSLQEFRDIWETEMSFIIRLATFYFCPSEMSQLILKKSYLRQNQESLGFLRSLAHNFFPVINFSIRLHSRLLLNFEEILQKTIDDLSLRYEKPAIIMDGICGSSSLIETMYRVNSDKRGKYILVDGDVKENENNFQFKFKTAISLPAHHQVDQALYQELEYVQFLFNKIQNKKCSLISVVGLNIFDVISILRCCDLFVSHYSGGVSKQTLIANLPGILHGTSTHLMKPTTRPEFSRRPDICEFLLPIMPNYEEKNPNADPRSYSYTIDYDSFREKLFALLNVIDLTARRGNAQKWS
jgi:hypothetical protein